jgi:hypothetical protein
VLFVMGIDRCYAETDWPLPDTRYRPFHLHSAGAASSVRGDRVGGHGALPVCGQKPAR